MHRIFVLCVLCLLCSYVATATQNDQIDQFRGISSLTIPVFMWSGNQLFTVKNEQIVETLTPEDIEYSLYSLLNINTNTQNTKLDGLFSKPHGNPEVIVMFVEPELRTDQIPQFGAAYTNVANGGSFSHLKNIVESSQSSFVASYATVGTHFSLLDTPLTRVSDAIKEGTIVVAREGESTLFGLLSKLSGTKTIQVSDLTSYLTSESQIFNNGVTDLIVVCFEKAMDSSALQAKLGSNDELIGKVSALVEQATGGNYVGIYSGNSPAPLRISWSFPYAEEMRASRFIRSVQDGNNTNNNTIPTTSNYLNIFTGPMLEAMIISFFLLAILMSGLCWMADLQTPDRFESPQKVAQREH